MSAFNRDPTHDIKRLTLRVSKLAAEVSPLLPMMEILMATIEDVKAAVVANGVAITSAVTLLQSLQAQLAAGAVVSTADLQSVVDTLSAQDASLSAVVSPPAPAPVVAPAPAPAA